MPSTANQANPPLPLAAPFDDESLAEPFEVVDARLQNAVAVAWKGEVDIAAVPALEVALGGAIRESAGALVLDLRELEFLDCCGLHVILRAQALLAREDRALAVVCPPGPVQRLFTATGMTDRLCLFASPEEAAAALVPAGSSAWRGSRDTTARGCVASV